MTQNEEIKSLNDRIEALEAKFEDVQSAFVLLALADLHSSHVEPGNVTSSDGQGPTDYEQMTAIHKRAFKILGIKRDGDEDG